MSTMVVDPVTTLSLNYANALKAYLSGAGESALQVAYELGRRAMTNGLGALELARIHQESLVKVIEEAKSPERNAQLIESASGFFAESLATLEMTHRGFQETIASLSTRTAELETSNKTLELEINERRKIQSDLMQSEERYRDLVEKALDVIYTLSTEGTITSFNPAFEKITGFKREEWLGMPFLPLVHPQDVDRCMRIYERLLRGETVPMFELQILSKSGEYLVGEFLTAPQFRDGSVVGVLGIARDITKRRRAEEQLMTSQLKLAEAQQIAHLGNWEREMKSGKMTWSAELYNIYGVDPATYVPTYETYLNLIHSDDRDTVRKIVEEAITDKKPFSFYHRFIRPDGTVRISHSRGVVVTDNSGDTWRMFGTEQDVTELKQAEEALRDLPNRIFRAQENERSRLARELHDDLCQRLSGMKLTIDVMETDVGRDKKALKKIETVKSQIDHIIKDVRRISWNLRPTTLDDLGLVAAAGKFCKDLSSTNEKVKIRFLASKEVPEHFDANLEIAVYRIVQESVVNALKHAKASRVVVNLKRFDGKLVVSITDDGKGFDTTKLHRKGPGYGLGLVSMRERANLLHGKFHLDSVPSQGTKITVELPLRMKDAD